MRERHITYLINLLEALGDGCPVCSLVKRTIGKSVDDFLYGNVNDPGRRQQIRASQGFCSRHAWQLQKLGDGLGQAIVYGDIMTTVARKLKGIGDSASVEEMLNTLGLGKKTANACMFCSQERDTEGRCAQVIWESPGDPEFDLLSEKSSGLCLPHLISALTQCPNKSLGKMLIGIEEAKISGLIRELGEFVRKHDYRFAEEGFGKGGDSWIRAIEKLAGKQGVF